MLSFSLGLELLLRIKHLKLTFFDYFIQPILMHLALDALIYCFFVIFIGSACSCILPDAFKTPKIQHDPNLLPDTLKSSKTQNDPNLERSDSEKKSKRSALRCFSSKSKSQKFQRRESKAPLIPASQDKGFLRRWKSCKSSERER